MMRKKSERSQKTSRQSSRRSSKISGQTKKLNYNDLFPSRRKKTDDLDETEWVVKSTKEYMDSKQNGQHEKLLKEIKKQVRCFERPFLIVNVKC